MNKFACTAACLNALAGTATAADIRPTAATLSARPVFGALPLLSSPKLSPHGTYVDHYLDLPETRTRILAETERFIAKHIGN